jgi:hypothetical protein
VTLLAETPEMPQLTDLAINVLETIQKRTAQSGFEDLIIDALHRLKDAEPRLTLEQRSSILALAENCYTPVGTLNSGVVDFSDIVEVDESNEDEIDMVGAGAILLAGRFSPEAFEECVAAMALMPERLAISFSKMFPDAPNLWIVALSTAAPDRLRELDNLQHDRISNKEFLQLIKTALHEGITMSAAIHVATQAAVNLIFKKGAFWSSLFASLATAGWIATGRFMIRLRRELKNNRLSPEHREQLEVALSTLEDSDDYLRDGADFTLPYTS